MQCEVKSNVLSVILVLVQARALVGSDDNAGVGGGASTRRRKRENVKKVCWLMQSLGRLLPQAASISSRHGTVRVRVGNAPRNPGSLPVNTLPKARSSQAMLYYWRALAAAALVVSRSSHQRHQ